MPSQSEITWSDEHQRYFRHIIGDDGVILDTMWLPEDSVDATEADNEASEESTIPSNSTGDPRRHRKEPIIHPDSGEIADPYSYPQPRLFTSGGYLPTQPDHGTPSVLPGSSGGIIHLSEVRPIPKKDLPPVEPPPRWPPVSGPPPAQASAFESTGSTYSTPPLHYSWDANDQRYQAFVYNYSTGQWVFSHWMGLGWLPKQPYTQSLVPQTLPSGATSPAGAFGYAGLGSSGGSMPKGTGAPLYGTYGQPNALHYEPVDVSYHVRPRAFFCEGRVLAVMMNGTPEGNVTGNITDYNSSSSFNRVKYQDNYVYTNVRRFIVVRQKREFCYACPIFTYSGRATTKRGVRPSEHGIAYSRGEKEQLLPGEGGITKPSIAVVMSEGVPKLHIASRIYYGIIHPIQYNVKVKEIGHVPKEQVSWLIGNWREEDDNDTFQDIDVTANAEIPEVNEEDDKPQAGPSGTSNAPGDNVNALADALARQRLHYQ